ncbi:MAG: hypothetical protein ACRDHB_00760 [Actinomycetota bacterium]
MGRYEELIEKRDSSGLSDEETDELGKLMAERGGEAYEGNADDPPLEVEAERVSKDPEVYVEEVEASKDSRDVDDSVMTREGEPGRQKDAPPPA